MKHDVVVVLPVTPSPPPRLDAPAPVLQSWLSRCHAFAALTALGGVPSVVVPLGQLPQGGGPLAVGLFGHSRSDTRLITVAEKLAHAAQVSRVGQPLAVCCPPQGSEGVQPEFGVLASSREPVFLVLLLCERV